MKRKLVEGSVKNTDRNSHKVRPTLKDQIILTLCKSKGKYLTERGVAIINYVNIKLTNTK